MQKAQKKIDQQKDKPGYEPAKACEDHAILITTIEKVARVSAGKMEFFLLLCAFAPLRFSFRTHM